MAKQQPAHEIRLGAIRATIWKNSTANQWSHIAWLFASSRAEICDMFTTHSTPASFAAWAKKAVA